MLLLPKTTSKNSFTHDDARALTARVWGLAEKIYGDRIERRSFLARCNETPRVEFKPRGGGSFADYHGFLITYGTDIFQTQGKRGYHYSVHVVIHETAHLVNHCLYGYGISHEPHGKTFKEIETELSKQFAQIPVYGFKKAYTSAIKDFWGNILYVAQGYAFHNGTIVRDFIPNNPQRYDATVHGWVVRRAMERAKELKLTVKPSQIYRVALKRGWEPSTYQMSRNGEKFKTINTNVRFTAFEIFFRIPTKPSVAVLHTIQTGGGGVFKKYSSGATLWFKKAKKRVKK